MENKLLEVGENWYQRTHSLREVWQNDSVNNIQRIKAYKLWLEMTVRVIFIKNEITKSRVDNFPKFAKVSCIFNLPSSNYTSNNTNNKVYFIVL